MNNLSQFTNVYQLQKTLRFELIPVGETQKHIEENGILENDQRRAENYKLMKKTIDEYHKAFIDRALTGAKLKGLDEFFRLYTQSSVKDEKWKTGFKKCKEGLRKEIVRYFTAQSDYSDLNKKELIQKRLKAWIDASNPELYYSDEFRSFTTYFNGYHTNRMNMYSDEEKATAIAYRLINENLPKFIDNMLAFEKVKATSVSGCFEKLCKEMEPWLNVASLDELFSLENYTNILTQAQIEAYNVIIGGRKTENEELQGLNEYINRYNQKNPDSKLPKMKILYKQILSERISLSWLPETFSDAAEVFDAVRDFSFILSNQYEKLKDTLPLIAECDAENIYCRSDAVTGISSALFGDWSVLSYALTEEESTGKKKAKKNDEEKKPDYYSLAHIQSRLNEYINRCDDKPEGFSEDCIARYFAGRLPELSVNIDDVLTADHDSSYTMTQSDKDALKAYLDSAMKILHFVKPLYVSPDSELKRDDVFYGEFAPMYEELSKMTLLYDKVRNFATKKPYSTEKIKLNFENKGQFLGGWVDSKTDISDNGTQGCGYLFRKKNGIGEYDYFLGISSNKMLFRAFIPVLPNDESQYERLDYYQSKSKTVYGSSYRGEHTYSEDKQRLLDAIERFVSEHDDGSLLSEIFPQDDTNVSPQGLMNKLLNTHPELYSAILEDGDFSNENTNLIESLKRTMAEMKRLPGADIVATTDYKVFTEIIGDIDSLANQKVYNYFAVSQSEFDKAVSNKKSPLYLFKISNKDLSYADSFLSGKRKSRGTENLHTMYFKAVMEGGNGVFDIGTAEVFYRKCKDFKTTIHTANEPLEKKNPLYKGKPSTFGYDIIKDRHYTCNKFQLHLSTFLNYNSPKSIKSKDFNGSIVNYLKNNPDVNIIGIDRGERHLLYISLIDRNGRVVRDKDGKDIQYSLNTISGEYRDSSGKKVSFETPYQELLAEKEKKRDEQRKNWGEIENIKELKAGYLSQVVHHIAKLMVEYNAIVVMEDLNFGFKRGRFKVERQVYQNFEKALIEKLNYLVFKDYDPDETGGLYHALQLTEKFTGFKDMTRQCGFIFYVPAWDTSKIDPTTGFVDLLKPKYTNVANVADAQRFFAKFKHIYYDSDTDGFIFGIDYSDFTQKAEGSRTKWDICTQGETRYTYNRSLNNNKGGTEKCNVTEKLKELFTKYGIDFSSGEDIRDAVAARSEAEFFRSLIKYLQIILAMRYSSAEDGEDFILSPVAGTDGSFYCSKTHKAGQPQDADANGAFNIARKGMMLLEQLDKAEKYNDWKITNKDWLAFAQEHTC